MPYFRKINVLFIHIPKTGGTSIEKYFSSKYDIPLDPNSLYGTLERKYILKYNIHLSNSLQHLTMNDIYKYNKIWNITNPFIFTVVRNPYERMMSELFYRNQINIDSSKEYVYKQIQKAIKMNLDNHCIPQYKFIKKNVIILHTETLQEDMHKLGFVDFFFKENENSHKLNYYDYLNHDSIQLINTYYELDFNFGYTMI